MTGTVPVAFVSSYAQLGGSERYLRLLLERLGPGWVEEVVTLQEGPFVAQLEEVFDGRPRVVATGSGPLAMLRAALTLRRDLFGRSSPIAVVHANGLKAALVCILATLGRKARVVWVKHDFSWDGTLANVASRLSHTVVGVSAAVVGALPSSSRIEVVHTGLPSLELDHEQARHHVSSATGLGVGEEVVLLVGRLHPAKGQIELIEAIPRVLESRPAVRFLFLGGDDPTTLPYAGRVRRRVAELGLSDCVSFAGYRTDAERFIAAADVVVIPSVRDERGMGREGFSLVALEAMMTGSAVVAYADGALGEVLGDCAALVTPGDRRSLADAIAGVLQDPERRRAFEQCGRQRARDLFDIDSMVESMKAVYRRAAQGRP